MFEVCEEITRWSVLVARSEGVSANRLGTSAFNQEAPAVARRKTNRRKPEHQTCADATIPRTRAATLASNVFALEVAQPSLLVALCVMGWAGPSKNMI